MANPGGSSLAKSGDSRSVAEKFAEARAATRAPGLGAAAAATFRRNESQAIRDSIVHQGGREWQKGGHHRVYLGTELGMKAIGMEAGFYGSGNVSWARLNGRKISNNSAREYLNGLDRTYYDVKTNTFHGDTDVAEYFRRSR